MKDVLPLIIILPKYYLKKLEQFKVLLPNYILDYVFIVNKKKVSGVKNGAGTIVCIYVNGTPALYCPARVTEKAAQ